jgi:hypothetical protein
MDDPFIADKIDYEALELNPNITRLSYVEFKRHFDEKKENENVCIKKFHIPMVVFTKRSTIL